MNLAQRKFAAADAATLRDYAGGHAVARTRLVLGGMVYVAGMLISPAVLAACKNYRALVANHMIELRPGPAPEGGQPTPQPVEDDKAIRARMIENMKAAGDPPWMYDHQAPVPPGAFKSSPPGPAVAEMTASGHRNANAHKSNP
jgi:hypothetical protein